MDTSLTHLVTFWLIAFAAYFIRGISGFGSGLIAIPLLVQFLPFKTVIPLMLLLDFTASVVLSRATRGQAAVDELKRLLPCSAIGVAAGAYLLVTLPKGWLLVGLGVFVLAFGLRNILVIAGTTPISSLWAAPAGLLGGSVGAVFGTGGPPYAIYLGHRIHDKSALRATFSVLFMIEGGLRIVAFFISGLLLNPEVWLLWLVGTSALGLGLWRGNKVHLAISNRQMVQIIGALLVLSGGSLLIKGVAFLNG
ncbi:MAG: hypothetical protein BWK76_12470 [Desulfobulbaceae bacterium A2]|nr:MAG: hypothetical protein BWK76_12470 [Desulfobulbaceae bacterium A2]